MYINTELKINESLCQVLGYENNKKNGVISMLSIPFHIVIRCTDKLIIQTQ